MIKKLRGRITLLAALVLALAFAAIIGAVNVINYNGIVGESDKILDFLAENNGRFPNRGGAPAPQPMPGTDGMHGMQPPPNMSVEVPYESRYFFVLMKDGEVVEVNVSNIRSVDTEGAESYARGVDPNSARGFIDMYRYVVSDTERGELFIFLDCGRRLELFREYLYASVLASLLVFILLVVIVFIFAGRIVKPVGESYEKQKRFITDAGHELKTPLTVIRANVDLLSDELGESESLSDISKQVDRLSRLTGDLVYLSRMEERGSEAPVTELPLSEIVGDTAKGFIAAYEHAGKSLSMNIQEEISIIGDYSAAEKLVSILLDNALKHSADGDKIVLSLLKANKSVSLAVNNLPRTTMSREQLDHVFDRFWRADCSRSSEVGGNGIGLSIARAIAESCGAKVRAELDASCRFTVTVLFPVP